MIYKNEMKLRIKAISENESFCRACVASFCAELIPTIEELNDIKTAVSEAVTNAIVHGYPDSVGEVYMCVEYDGNEIHITVKDCGVGIENIERALKPFFTTKPDDERSGMGFTIIKTFMDEVKVESKPNVGTVVEMYKTITETAV